MSSQIVKNIKENIQITSTRNDNVKDKIIFQKLKNTNFTISIYGISEPTFVEIKYGDHEWLYIVALYGNNLKYLSKYIEIPYSHNTIIRYEVVYATSKLIIIRLEMFGEDAKHS